MFLRYGDAAFRLSRKIHAYENFTDIKESQTSAVRGFDCSPHPITIRIIDAVANISSRQLELDSKFSLNGPYEQAADSRVSRSPAADNRRAGQSRGRFNTSTGRRYVRNHVRRPRDRFGGHPG